MKPFPVHVRVPQTNAVFTPSVQVRGTFAFVLRPLALKAHLNPDVLLASFGLQNEKESGP
jgi:hypothetical protein